MSKQFSQPPEGPKIGPVQEFDELPPFKKEQIGDLDALDAKPVVNQGIPASEPISEEIRKAAEAELKKVDDDKVAEATEQLEALQAVLEQEDEEEEVDTIAEDAEPTDKDKQAFMRSVLGDKPYKREYPLFGGMYVVELADIKAEAEDAIFVELSKDQKAGTVVTEEDWSLQLTRYQTVLSVTKISQSGKDVKKKPFGGTLKAGVKKLCKLNSTVYRGIMRTVRVFRLHLELLVEKSLRPDFWTAGGRD